MVNPKRNVLTDVSSITRKVLDNDNRFRGEHYDLEHFPNEAVYRRISLWGLEVPIYVHFSGHDIKTVVWGRDMENCIWCCYVNADLQISQHECVNGISKRTAIANSLGVWEWHESTC